MAVAKKRPNALNEPPPPTNAAPRTGPEPIPIPKMVPRG